MAPASRRFVDDRQAVETGLPGRLHLLYSARTPADFAYLPELRRLQRSGRLELALNTTREIPRGWRGERGRITQDQLSQLVEDPGDTLFRVWSRGDGRRGAADADSAGGRGAEDRVEEW